MLLPLLIQNLNMGTGVSLTVLNVFGQPNEVGEMSFRIEIAEIQETTDAGNVMIWDQDAWDTGKTWGA